MSLLFTPQYCEQNRVQPVLWNEHSSQMKSTTWMNISCLFDWLSHEGFLQVSDTASHVYLSHQSDYGSFKVHYTHTNNEKSKSDDPCVLLWYLEKRRKPSLQDETSTRRWCSCDTDALVRQDAATGEALKPTARSQGACVAKLLHVLCCSCQSYTEQKDKNPRKTNEISDNDSKNVVLKTQWLIATYY